MKSRGRAQDGGLFGSFRLLGECKDREIISATDLSHVPLKITKGTQLCRNGGDAERRCQRAEISETALLDSKRPSATSLMVLQPWIIVCLNPLRDERSIGNRAAPGFDSDGSRDDKQTPQRINVRRSILANPERRRTAKPIFRDEQIQRGSVRGGGGGGGMGAREKNTPNY